MSLASAQELAEWDKQRREREEEDRRLDDRDREERRRRERDLSPHGRTTTSAIRDDVELFGVYKGTVTGVYHHHVRFALPPA